MHRQYGHLVTSLTVWLLLASSVRHVHGGASLTDRLLALWTNGEVDGDSDVRSSNVGHPGSLDTTDDSLKRVLEFLSAKAKASDNKKVPSAALAGLNALVSGTARRPKPIDLSRQTPVDAVLQYFHELGIDDNECRKRTICELLTEPQAGYGIFGELLNYVFGGETPSPDTALKMTVGVYKEYYEAATNGRRMQECDQIYGACGTSYKEYIKLTNI